MSATNLIVAAHPAIKYLTALFDEADIVCLTFIHGTKTYAKGGAVTENAFVPLADVIAPSGIARLMKRNEQEHIYISMSTFKPGSTNRTQANIVATKHVFVDMDERGPETLAAIQASVAAGELPAPNIVVESSPNKYQAIWNVSGMDFAMVKALNKTLVAKFNTDPQTVDPHRVLRIAGFKNIKAKYPDPKPVASIFESAPNFLPYNESDFKLPLTVEPDRKVHPIAEDKVVQQSIEAMEYALTKAGLNYERAVWEGSGGAYKFLLDVCPWAANHENGNTGDAITVVQPSGAYAFICLHAHCADKDWAAFRSYLEEKAGKKFSFAVEQPKKPKPAKQQKPVKAAAAKTEESKPKKTESAKCGPPMSDRSALLDQVTTKSLQTTTADKIPPTNMRWIWRNRIAEKLNLAVGDPGDGKSLFSIYCAARLTTGSDWFNGMENAEPNSVPSSEVAFLAGEDDWDDTVVPRLMSAGADLTKIHKLSMVSVTNGKGETQEDRDFQLDTDIALLNGFLADHPNVKMVVVDPVTNYLGSSRMMDDQSVRRVLMPLKDLSEKYPLAVLAIMHLNKKVDLNAIYRIGGSMGFGGVARLAWLFVKSPEDELRPEAKEEFMMLRVKANIVKRDVGGLKYEIRTRPVRIEGEDTQQPYLAFTGVVDKDPNLMNPNKPGERPAHRPAEKLPAAIKWLTDFLAGGPKSSAEIMHYGYDESSFSRPTLQRAGEDLGVIKFEGPKFKRRDGRRFARS